MALTGTEFLKQVKDVRNPALSAVALKVMLDGNMPSFLDELVTCSTEAVIDGAYYKCDYRTPPQYLSVGTDADFVQWPLTIIDLQKFCDAHMLTSSSDGSKVTKFFIPTKKIVKNTWMWTTRIGCAIDAIPLGPSNEMTWPSKIAEEQQKINEAMRKKGCPITAFSRAKKAYISAPNMVGTGGPAGDGFLHFTGWYKLDGWGWQDQGYKPVDATGGHEASYADYSHGCDLVYYNCTVNGDPFTFDELCNHPKLWPLVSDQGAFNPRFPNTGAGAKEVLNTTARMPTSWNVPENYKGATFASKDGKVVQMSVAQNSIPDTAGQQGGTNKVAIALGIGAAALGLWWLTKPKGPAF